MITAGWDFAEVAAEAQSGALAVVVGAGAVAHRRAAQLQDRLSDCACVRARARVCVCVCSLEAQLEACVVRVFRQRFDSRRKIVRVGDLRHRDVSVLYDEVSAGGNSSAGVPLTKWPLTRSVACQQSSRFTYLYRAERANASISSETKPESRLGHR